MKQLYTLMALISALVMTSAASATPASDELFSRYKSEGAANFDAEHGKKNWVKKAKKKTA